jgi:hypothetical protein
MHKNDAPVALHIYHCFIFFPCRHQIVNFSCACHTWKFIMRFVTVSIFFITIILVT